MSFDTMPQNVQGIVRNRARAKLALRLSCPAGCGKVLSPCSGDDTAFRCRACGLKFIITNPSVLYPT